MNDGPSSSGPPGSDRDDWWEDEPDPAQDWAGSADGVGPRSDDASVYADPDPVPAEPGRWPDDAVVEQDWAPEEWDDWRGPMSLRRKLLVGGLGLAVILVLVGGVAWFWVQRQIDPPGPPGEEIELEVVAGATTEDIGVLLDDNGVIASSMVWDYWTRLGDKGPFQAGLYVFRESSSFDEAVAVLDAGPEPPESERVTIPEGFTLVEIVDRLADPEFAPDRWNRAALQAAVSSGTIRSRYQPADQPSLEGLLFPDTYEVADDADEAAFIRLLVAEMDERLTELDVESRAAFVGRTPYEIVIIASLIEEEARVPGDRAKISRVIHNRLAQGIPLGIDATSRYEAELAGRDREDIDFSSDSPFNTRRVQGLVPTPIAAPGQASLEAALAPEDGPWIFYVLADEEGNHFFTDSSREFERAKQECIRLDLGCG